MAVEYTQIIGNSVSSVMNIGAPILAVLFIGVMAFIALQSGMLTRYPQTAVLRIPRYGGAHKVIVKPARSVKGGKTEIKFGWFDKLQVSECPQKLIQEGDILEGIMNSNEEVNWISDVQINEAELNFKASVPENAQLAFAVAHDSAYVRTHKQKAWLQYLPTIALIITAFTFLGGCYILANMFKDMGAQFAGNYNDFAGKLENATIIIHTAGTGTGTVTGFPNQPTTNPNLPPG